LKEGIFFEQFYKNNLINKETNKLTEKGEKFGGEKKSLYGNEYFIFPENVLEKIKEKVKEENSILGTLKTFFGKQEIEVKQENIGVKEKKEVKTVIYEKYPPTHKTEDGHLVRSRGEQLIDNWLYNNNIMHCYEKRIPIEEDVYCDFYLKQGKVYIEYWGLEGENGYDRRKEIKIRYYRKYGLNLIEITNKDINNLDDVLPKKLL
jgi:hypothetical protein